MTRILWDSVGERFYETGVDRGVLYPKDSIGVPWNGLISVNESPTGGEANPFYMDGYKYHNEATLEEFEATIEAYTYPDEFALIDGTYTNGSGLIYGQQARKSFGLAYRTVLGNDVNGLDYAYKIHLVYNALAKPTQRSYATLSASPDALTFRWDLTTKPELVSGLMPTSHFVVDSTQADPGYLADLENVLYGSDGAAPRLPTPDEVVSILHDWPKLEIQQEFATGLASLKRQGYSDLTGDIRKGLYEAPEKTRLVETVTSGLYSLDE